MNWLGWFLTVQPEQTHETNSHMNCGTELPLGKTRSMFFRALMSLNRDQQSPVSYRLNSHVSVPPPGPSLHPDLPLPASPDPFLTQGSFTPSQLLISESGNLSVLHASIPLSPPTHHLPAKFKSHRRKAEELWSLCLHPLGNDNNNSAPRHCYNSSVLPPPV